MKIVHMRTDHIENPIGYFMKYPSVSWKIEAAKGSKAQQERIQVAVDAQMNNIIYDTAGQEVDSSGTLLPIELKCAIRYYWRVWVRSDAGEEAVSETAWFETAKDEKRWEAEWIRPLAGGDGVLFQDFHIGAGVAWARLSISGVGLYEVEIDGKKVGEEYLTPNFNDYDSWIQFQTYPVEDLLTPGNHRIEIILGSGWYKGRYLTFAQGTPDSKYGKHGAAIAELHIRYQDGREQLVKTDLTWRSRRSPIGLNNIYDGEYYDATVKAEGDVPVQCEAIGTERLMARLSLPVKKKEVRKPIAIIRTPENETVLDFGQNMAGWLVFYNRLPYGAKCTCVFGEVLQQDCFYHENMRSAKTEFTYVSDGELKWIRPHFTYYGFRYVKLTGFPEELSAEDFEAWALYSDMEQTGTIDTGNQKVNQLISNILWSQKSNFIDVPTDCPQRDERLGWTGDTQIFSMTAAYNMDVAAFFRKHMYDVWCEQQKNGGMVPMVVPDLFLNATSAAWGDIAIIVPWNMYMMYGNKQVLKEQYPGMRAWVEYILRLDEESGATRLWNVSSHFGDWLSLDAANGEATGGTDVHYIASAYYYYCTRLTAKAAAVLGHSEDLQKYEKLEKEIKDAFLAEYFTPSGRLAIDTQTAYVLSLYMELYRAEDEEKLTAGLVEKLKQSNNHLTTGFVGTPYLCLVLSQRGRSDLAYTLLLNEDFPGWLYSVNMGATTIWERWNSILPDGTMNPDGMNSLNHYAYGSIQEWMYKYILGITLKAGNPAWREFILCPKPDARIGFAKGYYDSPQGKIVSEWRYQDDGRIWFYFEIPFGTAATLFLPDESIRQLTSGSYEFYTNSDLAKKIYDEQCKVGELMADERSRAVLTELLPGIVKRSEEYANSSLKDSVASVFNEYTMLDLKRAVSRLKIL